MLALFARRASGCPRQSIITSRQPKPVACVQNRVPKIPSAKKLHGQLGLNPNPGVMLSRKKLEYSPMDPCTFNRKIGHELCVGRFSLFNVFGFFLQGL